MKATRDFRPDQRSLAKHILRAVRVLRAFVPAHKTRMLHPAFFYFGRSWARRGAGPDPVSVTRRFDFLEHIGDRARSSAPRRVFHDANATVGSALYLTNGTTPVYLTGCLDLRIPKNEL